MIKTALSNAKSRIRGAVLDAMCKQMMAAGPSGGRRPFDAEELKLLRAALLSQNLCCIDGQMVTAFERRFAFEYGVPYGVASTSGTAAIHVALGALDLNPGDEVITAPITDMGTIIPILCQGAIPVFADVDDTLNIDPAAVERCITGRTKAIVAVHLFGNPCDMDALSAVARRHGLPLIEDCSQSHWTEYKGRLVGTIGDIGTFSFQQSKHMTTGDGGMTITSNPAYHERMKLFADKGYARKGWGSRAYLFHAPNYRMTELVGAVGLAQLEKVKSVVQRRRALGDYLTQTGTRGLTLVTSVMADKDVSGVVGPLLRFVSRVVVTRADTPRAMPAAGLASTIATLAPARLPIVVEPDPVRAVERACADGAPIVAAGSIYLVGPLRAALLAAGFEPA